MMSKLMMFGVMLCVAASLSGSLQAAAVVYEPFDYPAVAYPASVLANFGGGTGFNGLWRTTNNKGTPFCVKDSGLTFTDDSGNELPVAGLSTYRIMYPGRGEANRSLSDDAKAALFADGSTIWFSILYQNTGKPSAFVIGTDTYDVLSGGDLSDFAAGGEGFGCGTVGSTILALAYDNSGGLTTADSSVDVSTAKLIAGKIVWKANGTNDELYLYNVTNLSVEPTTPIAMVTADLDQSAFDLVVLEHKDNNLTFDEIRIAGSFAEAMGASGSGPKVPVYIFPKFADVVDTRVSNDVELIWSNIEQDPNNISDLSVEVLFGTDPNETDGDMLPLDLSPISGQEPNSVTVPDLEDGIYYWQVNTTFGTDPCVVEGPLAWFEAKSDFPPDSVALGADQITWLGKEVPLFAEVIGDDDQSPLTYTWTVNADDPNVILTVDENDNSLASLTFFNSNPTGLVQSVQVTVDVQDENNPAVTSTVTVDVYDTACLAARDGLGFAAAYPGDLDGNCITNMLELVELSNNWLNDKGLNEPNILPAGTANVLSSEDWEAATSFDDYANTDYDGVGSTSSNIYIDMDGVLDNTTQIGVLRGNSDKTWVLRDPLPLVSGGYTSVDITFSLAFTGYEKTTAMQLEYSASGNFDDTQVVQVFSSAGQVEGDPYSYDQPRWYEVNDVNTITLDPATYSFTDTARIKWRMGGGSMSHRAYLDNIVITGIKDVDPNAPTVDAGKDVITWSGLPVTMAPDVVVINPEDGDLSYAWSANPADGVVFDPAVNQDDPNTSDVMAPTVIVTKTAPVGGVTYVILKLAVTQGNKEPVTDFITLKVFDKGGISLAPVNTICCVFQILAVDHA